MENIPQDIITKIQTNTNLSVGDRIRALLSLTNKSPRNAQYIKRIVDEDFLTFLEKLNRDIIIEKVGQDTHYWVKTDSLYYILTEDMIGGPDIGVGSHANPGNGDVEITKDTFLHVLNDIHRLATAMIDLISDEETGLSHHVPKFQQIIDNVEKWKKEIGVLTGGKGSRLAKLTVKELKDKARKRGVRGFSVMKKNELVSALIRRR